MRPSKPIMCAMMTIFVWTWLVGLFAPSVMADDALALAGVPLAPNGDFKIDDVLTTIPPSDCASPMLLIRNASGGTWFAAGIPKQD
jgi:hypothetical protein